MCILRMFVPNILAAFSVVIAVQCRPIADLGNYTDVFPGYEECGRTEASMRVDKCFPFSENRAPIGGGRDARSDEAPWSVAFTKHLVHPSHPFQTQLNNQK